ncbi:hypothetical protein CHS0354_010625 [Potamilus streckersoni]|uniref:Phosphatidylinositol-glycan-specific phospholipase D n=1 Tax=Potamilus streckersoni TaxID=2493646 RepID=A0AAE0SFU4_9BIVA|nr:hypothetical protein CHS0354_010625 [Potamilus streckersoni]
MYWCTAMILQICYILFGFFLHNIVQGCGITTHIEISHRAMEFFQSYYTNSQVDYRKLLLENQDALMAGSPYPDSFYDTICAKGQYHDVSEDTHWAPFLNASVNYIRKHFPQPWDKATEKLVVFLFGIVSHQTADILWHSLGIDQGFLMTMANVNFHGDFDKAHSTGDLGGDVVNNFELNMDYIPLTSDWYIPVDDLFNIYKEYYGNDTRMPKDVITDCTTLLLLGRIAEVLAAKEIFPDIANKSSFLLNQLSDYFVGGMDDMAGWTNRLWQQTILMLEHGTDGCDIPHNTLFVQCNKTQPSFRRTGGKDREKNGFFVRPDLKGLTFGDLTFTKELRGIRVQPKASLLDKIFMSKERPASRTETVGENLRHPNRVLNNFCAYSRLGWSYATGDLNSDGNDDLVVGAPGYGEVGSPQEGRVYIIYGTEDGIPLKLDIDLDLIKSNEGQILKGIGAAQSRFGSSLAVLDVNLDGTQDLVVGASSFALESPLNYNGMVQIFFGNPKTGKLDEANITVMCRKSMYCNLGWSLTTGDINNDGHTDLLLGTPFAPALGQQRGFVAALISEKGNTGKKEIEVETLGQVTGDQDYGWFGYDMKVHTKFGRPNLFISQTDFRICKKSDCSYDLNDTQTVGSVTYYELGPSPGLPVEFHGTTEFQQLGFSLDVGMPYPDGSYMLAVGLPGETVEGQIAGIPMTFSQTGAVHLVNISGGNPFTRSQFEGDRRYGRFGHKVMFSDLNSDGFDDLIIGSPYRTNDITEEFEGAEQGRVYIFYGGSKFPWGDGTNDCGNSWVHPCPGLKASLVLEWFGILDQARFGSNFIVLKSKNRIQLIVTAEHGSTYVRLTGGIAVFDF